MTNIGETLRELLENPALQDALAEAFSTGSNSPAQFDEISLADHLRHARGVDVLETPFEVMPEKLKEAIQSFVIDRLPQPTPITLDDLTSLAIAHLAGVDIAQARKEESVAHAYQRFVTCAMLEIEQERLKRGSFYTLGDEWAVPEPDSILTKHLYDLVGVDSNDVLPSEQTSIEIWRSQSGFSFDCIIAGYCEESCDRVYGTFAGYCTERAFQHVESGFEGLVGSIAKTVNLSGGSSPSIDFLVDGDGRRVFAASLSACCHLSGSESAAILDRLRNAVILLSHADTALADPISLSLSFAAIEALVCEKHGKPVNQQIKEHVSTLLVQRDQIETLAAERKARERVLGKLYDIRCEVLHGNQVSAPDKAANCVRQIAAGVVRGVVNWMENQERTGADASWKEFMDEINAASRKPGIIVGVPDLSELIPNKVPS